MVLRTPPSVQERRITKADATSICDVTLENPELLPQMQKNSKKTAFFSYKLKQNGTSIA
jgi:hypothetical protein